MNMHAKICTMAAAVLALGLGAAPRGYAQAEAETPRPPPSAPTQSSKAPPQPANVAVAEKKAGPASGQPGAARTINVPKVIAVPKVLVNEHKDHAFVDRKVRGSDGRKLGEVKDLLVDAGAGEVPYAVVESGATLRLVPFKALVADPDHARDFTVNATSTEWETFPTLAKETFATGTVTLGDEERRRIAARFARAKPGPAAPASAFYTNSISRTLLRCSRLDRKEVRAGSERLGRIEAVLVDPKTGRASALFQPDDRFVGVKETFEVALANFALGAEHEPATTALGRDDFLPAKAPPSVGKGAATAPAPANATAQPQQKTPAAAGMAANAQPQPPAQKESAPAPTGRTSAEQTPGGGDAKLLQAAQSVRASLDQEAASLARVDVRVNPENGRLVLRGSVADENLKKAIEERATQAAGGAPVDSQLSVEKKK